MQRKDRFGCCKLTILQKWLTKKAVWVETTTWKQHLVLPVKGSNAYAFRVPRFCLFYMNGSVAAQLRLRRATAAAVTSGFLSGGGRWLSGALLPAPGQESEHLAFRVPLTAAPDPANSCPALQTWEGRSMREDRKITYLYSFPGDFSMKMFVV